MTGAEIVGELLRADTAITALVPIARIKGGRLPDNIPLPALLVRTVSVIERQPLTGGALVRRTDRTSVTVRAATYDEQTMLIKMVATTGRGRTGDIGGGLNVAITTAGTGPDLNGPANSFEQAQDFRVGFDDPA